MQSYSGKKQSDDWSAFCVRYVGLDGLRLQTVVYPHRAHSETLSLIFLRHSYVLLRFAFSPHDTPFEDGTFKLTLEFTEEYPNKPPTVRFVSKMFHPNGKCQRAHL